MLYFNIAFAFVLQHMIHNTFVFEFKMTGYGGDWGNENSGVAKLVMDETDV